MSTWPVARRIRARHGSSQARQLSWTLAGRSEPMRFLIRDRDQKFTDLAVTASLVTIVTLLSESQHPPYRISVLIPSQAPARRLLQRGT